MRQDNQAALDAAFRLSLDLADITEHQGWRTARDQVLAALAAGPGLVALLGPAGTGKTLLLCELARALRAAGRKAELVGRGDLEFDAGTGEVVLVDEASRMDDVALDALALPGVAAVLADLPGLETRLDSLGAALTIVRLAPLRPDEIGAFVADRFGRAGQPADLLTAGAVEALAFHSAGVPRVLNLLARAALFMAETEGAARVEEEHVSLAMALRDGGAPDIPEIDALGEPAEACVQMIPGRDGASCNADGCEQAQAIPPRSGLEAETLPRAASVDPIAPADLEAVIPEPPPATLKAPAQPTPPSPSRTKGARHGAVLLVLGVLLVASLATGWSLGPQLAQTVRVALAGATGAPSPTPEPPGTNPAGGQSP